MSNAISVQSPLLAALPGIRHAFFTRQGGVSEGLYASLNGGTGSNDDQTKVAENRARMAAALGVTPDRFLTAWQIHSPDCLAVDGPWTERPRADALATVTPKLAVTASAADCGPILFADAEARVVAAAHSGWKGAVGGVLESTVARMEELGAKRARIVAAIGPLIRQQSYEVGAEFVERFTATDSANARYFVPSSRTDHAMFDLAGYIRARLERAGIGAIDDVGLDTYADPRFFSYRRTTHHAEPDYGRNIHALVLD